MKTKTILFSLLIFFAVACTQTKEYTLNGSFSQPQTEEWIYLRKMFSEEIILDSARIINGKFSFKGEATDVPEAYALSYHYTKAATILYPVFLESGKIDVLIEPDDWEMKSVVSGGKTNDEYQKQKKQRVDNFITEIHHLNTRLNHENTTDEERENINARITELWKKAEEFDVAYIKQYPQSTVSVYLLSMLYYNLPLHETEEMLRLFSDDLKQTDAYKMIESEHRNQMQLAGKTTAASVNDTDETMVFELNNNQPLMEMLAENNRGKVVYVDVWATWCGNCMVEFPHSVELHKKLDSEKITFAYIAIDSQKDTWRNIISEKQLNGQHVLLNKEQEEQLLETHFGVSRGIPRYMIIDKNGNLINANAPRPSHKETEKLLTDLANAN